MRRRWMATAAVALLAMAGLGACGDDEPAPTSVPDTAERPASTTTQPGGEDQPSDGAEPGQDGDMLDPPGGTTPTPDPGGDSGGANGNNVDPETDRDSG